MDKSQSGALAEVGQNNESSRSVHIGEGILVEESKQGTASASQNNDQNSELIEGNQITSNDQNGEGEHDLNNEINDLSGQKFDGGHLGESNLIAEGKALIDEDKHKNASSLEEDGLGSKDQRGTDGSLI